MLSWVTHRLHKWKKATSHKCKRATPDYSSLSWTSLSKNVLFRVMVMNVGFNDQDLLDKVIGLLKTGHEGDSYEKRDFVRFLIDRIFKQLEQGQDIAHYEPCFGSDMCIFC